MQIDTKFASQQQGGAHTHKHFGLALSIKIAAKKGKRRGMTARWKERDRYWLKKTKPTCHVQHSSEVMAAPGRECHKLSQRVSAREDGENIEERRRLGRGDAKRLKRGRLLEEENRVNGNKMTLSDDKEVTGGSELKERGQMDNVYVGVCASCGCLHLDKGQLLTLWLCLTDVSLRGQAVGRPAEH